MYLGLEPINEESNWVFRQILGFWSPLYFRVWRGYTNKGEGQLPSRQPGRRPPHLRPQPLAAELTTEMTRLHVFQAFKN